MKDYKRLLIIAMLFGVILGCKKAPELPSVIETMQADSDFSRFLEVLDYTDLVDILNGEGYITVLTPRNSAVDSFLSQGGYADVTDVPKNLLKETALYHMEQGIASEAIFQTSTGYFLTPSTLSPGNHPLVMYRDDFNGTFKFNASARIIRGDISARNGMIHTVSHMLTLPNMMDILENDKEFSHFVEAIDRAGARNIFDGSGTYTVFAPFNAAFERYFDNKPGVTDLDDLTDEQIKEIVLGLVINGNKRYNEFSSLFERTSFNTLLPNVKIAINVPIEKVIVNDTIATTLMDVQATNGVIHFIDRVIEP
ncbi:MAG: fasciclin domain-containing protein [Bacteroidetes bacterium]|nr:fasciclin domain-containing protein [Bacteroidota bacterium]